MSNKRNYQSFSIRNFLNAKGTVFILISALLLGACDNQQENNISENPGNVTTKEVVENTAKLDGKTVTVVSKPLKKVGSTSFTVSDQKFFGSEPVLVVNASGQPFTLPEDNDLDIQVTGIVKNLVIADVEREYNLKLDKQYYVEYENKPALIAKSMALAPEPGEITKDPSQFYGKRMAVRGEVEDIQNAKVFTLDEDQLFGAEDLLVFNVAPKQPIKKDELVAITGTLRPFVVAEFDKEYDLGWDLKVKQKIEAEYKNKPVFVADSVYPSAVSD
ncbi:MAG: hypothetical protein AAF378_03130 [Cyanobacteria bacterium P01_A01_bin.84]